MRNHYDKRLLQPTLLKYNVSSGGSCSGERDGDLEPNPQRKFDIRGGGRGGGGTQESHCGAWVAMHSAPAGIKEVAQGNANGD